MLPSVPQRDRGRRLEAWNAPVGAATGPREAERPPRRSEDERSRRRKTDESGATVSERPGVAILALMNMSRIRGFADGSEAAISRHAPAKPQPPVAI